MELLPVWITAQAEIFVQLTVFAIWECFLCIKADLVWMQRKYENSHYWPMKILKYREKPLKIDTAEGLFFFLL